VNWATGENTNVLCKLKPGGGHRHSHNEGLRQKKKLSTKSKSVKPKGSGKRKGRKTQKREERCERGRSVRLMINGWQTSQACSRVCKGEKIQSILVFFLSIF